MLLECLYIYIYIYIYIYHIYIYREGGSESCVLRRESRDIVWILRFSLFFVLIFSNFILFCIPVYPDLNFE
jgi:hypothetical protein